MSRGQPARTRLQLGPEDPQSCKLIWVAEHPDSSPHFLITYPQSLGPSSASAWMGNAGTLQRWELPGPSTSGFAVSIRSDGRMLLVMQKAGFHELSWFVVDVHTGTSWLMFRKHS